MVRSNTSVGGKILLILITMILTLALLVGVVFIVYKKASVRSIAGLFGADDLISESYDGTIEDLVSLLAGAVSDGSLSMNDLIEISPLVGEKLDAVLDDIEETGLISVDRDTLYATPVNSLSASLGSLIAVTATLDGLSSTLGFTLPDLPLITGSEEEPLQLYSQANLTDSGEIGSEFLFGGDAYSFYTRTTSYASTYTDGEETENIVTWNQYSLYTLAGVSEGENGTLRCGNYTLYLCTEGEDEAEPSYAALTPESGAVYSYTAPADPAEGSVTFALGSDESVCVRTGDAEYTAVSELFTEDWTDENSVVYSPEVAAAYKYTPHFYADAESGNYVTANTYDSASGKYVTDETAGGFALILPNAADESGYYTQTTELYCRVYTYSEAMTADEANALVSEAIAAGVGAPAIYNCTNGIAALPATYAMTALSSALDTDNMTLDTLCDYLGMEFGIQEDGEGSALLETVRHIPLGYLNDNMQAELQGIALGDVIVLDADSPRMLLTLAYGEEGVGYEITEEGELVVYEKKTVADLTSSLNTLRIGDLVDVTDGSAAILQAIQDWTLADFSDSTKVGSLTLGDVLTIDGDSPAILQALKDVTLDGMSGAVDRLTLDEVLGDSINNSELLSMLRGSTLQTLAEDIASLSVQSMFADSVYTYYDTGYTVSSVTDAAALYGAENLYVWDGAVYTLYSADGGYDGSETLYSPYRLLSAGERSDYAGVPLYYYDETSGQMQLATAVTGWSMTAEQFAEYGGYTLYYAEGGGYTQVTGSVTADTVFTASAVWYWDPATEKMQSVRLTASEYGVTVTAADNYFTRLAKPGDPAQYNGTDYYTESNLYYYDVEKESWQRVTLTGVWLNASGSEVAVTDETDTTGLTRYYKITDGTVPAGATLYTYGEVIGVWKYLVRDGDGFEQTYTLEDVGSMVSNINHNINTATLRELVGDGIITINTSDGQTQEDILNMKYNQDGDMLGDCTVGQLISLIAGHLSSPGTGG